MNRIKAYLAGAPKTRAALIGIAVLFASAGIAQATAATTIGTSITTTGSISTTGTGALSVAGLASFLGGATTTQLTLLAGDTIKNAVASTTSMSGTLVPDALTVAGATTLASTTATTFKVGQTGTQMSSAISGYCTVTSAIPATNASSTQTYATCTPTNSVTLSGTAARVLVQATSSLPYYVVVQAASSTAAGLIQVALTNFSTSTSVTSATYALNFWAFQ